MSRDLPISIISFSFILSFIFISCSSPSSEKESEPTTEPPAYVFSEEILTSDLRKHINFLASEGLGGREAGTSNEDVAAKYIADFFSEFELVSPSGTNSYLQEFIINFSGSQRNVCNVAGYLPGTGNTDEVIIIGAHYDHLGNGSFGSLYTGSDPMIHNGADDNASGTAGLLELAHYFSVNRPKTNLLFLGFSGEEMGLFGSAHYVNNPLFSLENTLAMINMDMIGRLNNNNLIINGVGSSTPWTSIINSVESGDLNLFLNSDANGASDHANFNTASIPVLHYFTDLHGDYHRPSDDIKHINFEGSVSVLNHLKKVVLELDDLDKSDLPHSK